MGHYDVVRCLLTSSPPLEGRDALGATPLWAAARNGRTAVTHLLLQRGAEKDRKQQKKRGGENTWMTTGGWVKPSLFFFVCLFKLSWQMLRTNVRNWVELGSQRVNHFLIFMDGQMDQDAKDIDGETPLPPDVEDS